MSTATVRACPTCGLDLTGTHGKRKYCSEKCRKAQYAGVCGTCGAPTNGYDGPGTASARCGSCWLADHTQSERNEALLFMWEAGLPTSEIARRLEMTEGHVRSFVDRQRRIKGRQVGRRALPKWNAADRYRLIAQRVREGATNQEIGDEIGTSSASVAQMIQYARAQGFDIPRRAELVEAGR